MDRKNLKQIEQNNKKLITRPEDRGDMKKCTLKQIKRKEIEGKIYPPDRGDLRERPLRPSIQDKISKTDQNIPESPRKTETASQYINIKQERLNTKKSFEKSERNISVEFRKRIRDRYTLRPRVPSQKPAEVGDREALVNKPNTLGAKTEQPLKTEVIEDQPREKCKEPQNNPRSDKTKADRTRPDRNRANKNSEKTSRKPVIQTITSKYDTSRVYKAVTFTEQRREPRRLQIKLPKIANEVKKSFIPKPTDAKFARSKLLIRTSSVNVKTKLGATKKSFVKLKNQKSRLSPIISAKVKSPPTEVAKWAPSSINRHTMPYYEAWVNTTLAAISRHSKKERQFLEEQNYLNTFKRQMEQRQYPTEVYCENFTDEKYTGRIKVTQK